MSKFSFYNIIKSNGKKLAATQGIKLSSALELIAKQAKFSNFHDLSTVAHNAPQDQRLMVAALGISKLEDALYAKEPYAQIEEGLEDQLCGSIADTNASGFTMENIEVNSASFDESTGVLALEVFLTYQGVQDPDQIYVGSAFNLEVVVQLARRENKWKLADNGLEIRKMALADGN